jgi:CRP-like cAMP-binding protein
MTDRPARQSPADGRSPDALAANPTLSDAHLVRLGAWGSPDQLEAGEVAFAAGDQACDLIAIEKGATEVVRPSTDSH